MCVSWNVAYILNVHTQRCYIFYLGRSRTELRSISDARLELHRVSELVFWYVQVYESRYIMVRVFLEHVLYSVMWCVLFNTHVTGKGIVICRYMTCVDYKPIPYYKDTSKLHISRKYENKCFEFKTNAQTQTHNNFKHTDT